MKSVGSTEEEGKLNCPVPKTHIIPTYSSFIPFLSQVSNPSAKIILVSEIMSSKLIMMVQQIRPIGIKEVSRIFCCWWDMGLSHHESSPYIYFSQKSIITIFDVLIWMIIIFEVYNDENYCRLCLYLNSILCIFVLKVVPTMHTFLKLLYI